MSNEEMVLEGEVTLESFMELTATCQLQMLNQSLANVPEEKKQEFKEHVFDQVNFLYSAILNNFAPEIEMHPDLTTEAMLEAEVNYIKNHNMVIDINQKKAKA